MTSITRRAACALLVTVLVPACNRGPARPRPNVDYLTQEQMREGQFTTVFDAIESLRANWLVARGTDSFATPSEVWVYFDSTKLGGVETLKSVRVSDVIYVRHYSGIDATTRWGVGHSAGVIYLSSHQ